ncbi:MAG TPA: alpha/beta hydrolase [Smithellaceae bacterium]|nr:alpha/beta hydrolase [Smithella sp.]HPL97497.1 alpha/beta hydrolase [Smithellaceae bacterium]
MKILSSPVMILGMLIFCTAPAFAGAPLDDSKIQFIDVLNQRIRIYETGCGQTVLLIHGLPGCIEDWEPIMPELSKRFHIIAYDRPGHGFSSANNLKYNLDQNADIAFAIIHKLCLNNPVIVGHSYGGSITLAMAVRDISSIKAFVSVSPIISTKRKPDLIFKILKIPLMGSAVRFFIKLFGRNMVKKGMDIAFDPNQKDMPQEFIDKRCMIISQPNNVVTTAREEMAICPDLSGITNHYCKIKKPLFIVHGSNDRVVPVGDVISLQEKVPGSRLILLKETGHMVQYAKPTELIKVIEEAAD